MTIDHFGSAYQRLKRAKSHIKQLDTKIRRFFQKGPHKTLVKEDPNTGEQTLSIKFTKRLPDDFELLVTEALEHMRHALDQATYASTVASGVVAPKNAPFPFADTPEQLENAIKGRCKDVPQEILALARAFKPYKGGNIPLWALNKAANKKHTFLMPVGIGQGGMYIRNVEVIDSGPFSVLVPRWDRAENEIPILRYGKQSKVKYDLDVHFSVAFQEGDATAGEPVIPVLSTMAREVERVLAAFEAETRRLWPSH
jgi:hypothetical protein